MTCNCPSGNCTCGCQSIDPCAIPSCQTACSSGEPCAQTESSCESTQVSDPCNNCNLFVETTQSFSMPACSGTGSMFVDDASRLFPGAVLYAAGVGFLTVISIVDATEVIVQNNCPECSDHVLNPGEAVASGTQFGVGVPFCASEGVEFTGPLLNSDFFIPAVSACALIAVTTSDGLAIGDTVSINGNRYRINDIPTTTTIEICNDGEGGSPGTLVEKDPDGDGVLDYPVLRISGVNPCVDTAVDEGRLIVCATGSTQRAMEGTIQNQIPAWDTDDEVFKLRVADNLAVCVTLECCLNLDPEQECGEYLINVSPNTDEFVAALADVTPNPLQVKIDGDEFCVTEVIDEDTLRVIPNFDVGEATEYGEGAVICIAECCSQCTPTIWTNDDTFMSQGCTEELLISTGLVTLSAPTGVETHTLPASLADNEQSGFEEGAGFLWQMDVMNDECCDCRKYIEITSNYEMATTNTDPDLFINIEVRILKVLPTANSQAFAGHPFVSPRGVLVGTQTPDLITALPTINTHKGTVFDRGFINPGEVARFLGHVRIVTENNSGGPLNFDILVNWRAWVKLWNFGCANISIIDSV